MWIVMRFRVTHLFSDLEYQEKLTCWPSWSIFVVSGCIFDTKWPVHEDLIYKSVNMEWRRPWIVWFVMISVISGVLKNPSFFPPKPFGWRTPGDRFWYSIFSSWPISGLNKRRQAWKAVMTFARSTQRLILSLNEKKSWRMLLPRIKGDRACLLIRHLVVVKTLMASYT